MNSRFSRSWLRLWPGVLLTLWAGSALAPQARAGCSYDAIAPMPAGGTSPHANAAANTLTKSSPHSSVPEHRPCSGPNCSGAPRAPLIPLALPVVFGQDWAYLPAGEHGRGPDSRAYRPEDGPHTPIFRCSRIFHPPR
jgi:hypothetical protein